MNKLAYSYRSYKKVKKAQYSTFVLILTVIAGIITALVITLIFVYLTNSTGMSISDLDRQAINVL